MTDQAALAYETQTPSASRPSRVKLAAGLGAVTLLAVAAGIGIAFLIATPTPPEPAEDAAAAVPANPAAYASVTGPLTLVPIAPVITNIAAPTSAIIRIEASLLLKADAQEDPEVLAAQIGADTLAFARSLELAQIEGARGLLHLREDLKERATLRSSAVADLVIHSLVAQ